MAKGLLIIRTLTPTHPGAGTSTGAIDLMLQREVTTGFPFIQGSSLKGAMRGHLRDEDENVLNKVFGPRDVQGSDLKKGALIISDASLLFYPVRSLKGLYALVTCPEILRRLKMSHIGLNTDDLIQLNEKDEVKALSDTKIKYEINDRIYFEDLNFTGDTLNEDSLSWLKDLRFGSEIDEIKSSLFIVHDDIFQYFLKFATMVISRNRIDYNSGTVDKKIGGLWSEEHLPPETYLFSYLEDNGKEIDGNTTSFNWLRDKLNSKVIHLGGDETVGKGFVELRFAALDTNSSNQEGKNG